MNTKNILVGFLAMGLLAACSMSAPSQISISPIEVKQTTYRQAWPIGAFDENRVGGLADYYTRYGDGPLRLTLTYADNQKDAKVRAEINKLADRLRHQGAADVLADILPVAESAQAGMVMVDFTQVTSQAPAECGLGHSTELRGSIAANEDGTMDEYHFGCGVDRYVAEQVARPKDLLGSTEIGQPSADRASKRLEDYRNGKDFKDLKASNASEVKL